MEYTIQYPLSREEIIKILDERYLDIKNAHLLSHDELWNIYAKFALPLEQRHNKYRPYHDQRRGPDMCSRHKDPNVSSNHIVITSDCVMCSYNVIIDGTRKRCHSPCVQEPSAKRKAVPM